MQLTGHIAKMSTSIENGVAQYKIKLDEESLLANDLIGKEITLRFNNKIKCSNCSTLTKKSYSQGFCFNCARTLASCDLCIMRPETCHYHLGTCREPEWGEKNCFQPHIVYLANSSGIKVGITKKINIPHRWIDQGAIAALPIIETRSRKDSGVIEKYLKNYVNDKTNWRKMLQNKTEKINLQEARQQLLPNIKDAITKMNAKILASKVTDITYPVLQYPDKINSINLDKTPTISSKLKGIKGQYLLFEQGVINIRKFSSYNITLSI